MEKTAKRSLCRMIYPDLGETRIVRWIYGIVIIFLISFMAIICDHSAETLSHRVSSKWKLKPLSNELKHREELVDYMWCKGLLEVDQTV